MADPTIGEMIAKHNEIKAYVEAEDAAHTERLKPYKAAMNALVTACGVQLQTQMGSDGKANFACDDGTAYLQHGLSVKVDNREAFLDFVANDHWDFLDAGALKDPVRDWIAANHASPPGIKAEPFVKCIIRR